ncbi:MAG: hypothetical protein ACI39C_12145 [Dietzia sp.]
MRTLTRFGIATAAAAIASATALAGAGVAGAQFAGDTGSVAAEGFTTRSASTISADRTPEGVTVTYTNKTDKSLVCGGVSAPSAVVGVFDDHVKRHGAKSLTERAGLDLQAKLARFDSANMADKVFVLNVDGLVVGGTFEPDFGEYDFFIEAGKTQTWNVPAPTGYTAGALVVCGEFDENYDGINGMPFSYVEYVSTSMAGGGSGSADVFGSLGSLGS